MSSRALALAGALLLWATGAAGQTVSSDPQNRSIQPDMRTLDVHVGGRVVREPLGPPLPRGATAYRHQWPGIYFEAAFEGDRVVLKFDDEANEYRLTVDALAPITLAQPGRAEVTIGDLRPGRHDLRLEKVTESIDKVGQFGGFYVPRSARPIPIGPRARQIEFIGDSSMSGYGDRSPKRQCTPEEVRLTSDTPDAYPALVAKHYDADYQVNAISGRGLVRNYAGVIPEYLLPLVYPYIMLDKTVPYADRAWQPQIIVIKLNADLVTDLQPGEKWKTIEELAADYARGFGVFIGELHRRSPDAAILIWWFDVSQITDAHVLDMIAAGQKTITDAARQAGVRAIDFLPMKNLGFDLAGCDSHPSLADHRKTTTWLIDYLDARPELWDGK